MSDAINRAKSDTVLHESADDCWNRIGVWGDGTCPRLQEHLHCRSCPVFTGAASRLLDREPPTEYLDHWARHFAAQDRGVARLTESALVFRNGEEWFALPSVSVVEVGEKRVIHALPHRRSSIVLGIVNIRGELLVTVSLGEALGLGADRPNPSPEGRQEIAARILVVKTRSGRLAMPVNEVTGIVRYGVEELKSVPSTVSKAPGNCLQGLLTSGQRTIRLLEAESLFAVLERQLM